MSSTTCEKKDIDIGLHCRPIHVGSRDRFRIACQVLKPQEKSPDARNSLGYKDYNRRGQVVWQPIYMHRK